MLGALPGSLSAPSPLPQPCGKGMPGTALLLPREALEGMEAEMLKELTSEPGWKGDRCQYALAMNGPGGTAFGMAGVGLRPAKPFFFCLQDPLVPSRR